MKLLFRRWVNWKCINNLVKLFDWIKLRAFSQAVKAFEIFSFFIISFHSIYDLSEEKNWHKNRIVLLKDFKIAFFLDYFIMLCLCHHNNGFFSASIMAFIKREETFSCIVEELTASNSQLSHQHEAIIKDRLEGSFLSKVFFQDDNTSPYDFLLHILSRANESLREHPRDSTIP